MPTVTLVVATAVAILSASPPNNSPWELVEEDEGIRVWARDVPGSSIREVKAEAIVNLPAERIWAVLKDVPHYVDFMPYMIEGGIVGKDGSKAQYEYQLIDPPFVDRRDYTLRVSMKEDPAKGLWIRSWKQANNKGPPIKEDTVRVQICDGTWTVERLGSKSTRVEYWLYTDPGGSIPSWIANKANSTSVPDLMKAVRKRAHDPKWKKD